MHPAIISSDAFHFSVAFSFTSVEADMSCDVSHMEPFHVDPCVIFYVAISATSGSARYNSYYPWKTKRAPKRARFIKQKGLQNGPQNGRVFI